MLQILHFPLHALAASQQSSSTCTRCAVAYQHVLQEVKVCIHDHLISTGSRRGLHVHCAMRSAGSQYYWLNTTCGVSKVKAPIASVRYANRMHAMHSWGSANMCVAGLHFIAAPGSRVATHAKVTALVWQWTLAQ